MKTRHDVQRAIVECRKVCSDTSYCDTLQQNPRSSLRLCVHSNFLCSIVPRSYIHIVYSLPGLHFSFAVEKCTKGLRECWWQSTAAVWNPQPWRGKQHWWYLLIYFSFIHAIYMCVCVCVCCDMCICNHLHKCINTTLYGNKPLILVDALSPLKEGLHNIPQMVKFVNICQPTNHPSQSGLFHPGTGETKASVASTSSSSMSALLITEDHSTDLQIDRWKWFAIFWHGWQPSAF